MNSTMNLLLRAAIAAAASDREKFVDKVSSIIEERAGTSPETAQQLAGGVNQLVDMLDQHLFFEQLSSMGGSSGDTQRLEEKIDRLTIAIDQLNANLEKIIGR